MGSTETQIWQSQWQEYDAHISSFARKALAELGPSRERTLLDLGCGDGADSILFAKRGFRVTSLDFSDEALHKLSARAADVGLQNITNVRHDFSRPLPFTNRSFDVVFAHLSLHYFDHAITAATFAEIRRVLVSGGILFVKCRSERDYFYGKGKKTGDHMYFRHFQRHFFTPAYMKEVLQDFTIMSIRRTVSMYWGHRSAFVQAVARNG